jgi:hypothetical protein
MTHFGITVKRLFAITEKSFHRAAQILIFQKYGLLIVRSDSHRKCPGPFVVKKDDVATYVGMTLEELVMWSGIDLTEIRIIRTRKITRRKTWRGRWLYSGEANKSPKVVNQQVPA